MNETVKEPDRIFVSKHASEIIDKIDRKNYFGLSKSVITRPELFLFAMALGYETLPTKLENTVGLFLDKDTERLGTLKSLMYALFIKDLKNQDQLDEIDNTNKVYDLCQQYANTGFEILEDYLKNKTEDALTMNLIKENNESYDKLFNDNN